MSPEALDRIRDAVAQAEDEMRAKRSEISRTLIALRQHINYLEIFSDAAVALVALLDDCDADEAKALIEDMQAELENRKREAAAGVAR